MTLRGIQRFLRRNFIDSFSGYDSFRYGSSTSFQRTEAWWSQFRKANGTSRISFFRDVIGSIIYENNINYHVEIMLFCFMFIIQQELDEMKSMWNTHYIKEVRNSECPIDRPNILYFMSEQSGGRSFRFHVNEMHINPCHPFFELPDVNSYTNETQELVRLMCEEELEFPCNATEAKNIFISIIRNIESRPHSFWYNISFEHTDFDRVYHSNNANTLLYWCLLMGRKFLEGKFLRRKFLQLHFPKKFKNSKNCRVYWPIFNQYLVYSKTILQKLGSKIYSKHFESMLVLSKLQMNNV